MNQYFTYIMTNKWFTTLYIGVTNSLQRRVYEHQYKLLPGFSSKYNTDRLVYFESHTEIRFAIAREKQFKGWTRARKVALIDSLNPTHEDLSLSP